MGPLRRGSMEFQGIIMAGGSGSRMTEITSASSKCLLPVGNIPLFMHPLQMLKDAGISEIIVIVSEHDKIAVQEAVTNEVDIEIDIVHIPKNEEWGTAESLKHIKDKIKKDMIVVSCDLITDFSLLEMINLHRSHNASLTILLSTWLETLKGAAIPGQKSKHKLERDIIGMDEKSRLLFINSEADFDEGVPIRLSVLSQHPCMKVYNNLMDAHLYIMKKELIDFLLQNKNISTLKGEMLPNIVSCQFGKKKWHILREKGSQDESSDKTEIVNRILNEENYLKRQALKLSSWNDHWGTLEGSYHGDDLRCFAYVNSKGFCVRANTLVGYMEANRQVLKTIKSCPEVQYPKSHVNESIIGKECELAEKTSVKKSVVGDHCQLKEKVKISNSIVLDHVIIDNQSSIQGCILCNNVVIESNCDLKNCIVGPDQRIEVSSSLTNEMLQSAYELMEI